jgi:methyl-accepting chemotaxis protein
MPNPNRSKYPEIIVDKDANMASGSLNTHHLTVEEYYDLLHHTHGFSDLVDDEGTSINELVEIVDQFSGTVNTLSNTVEELTEQLSQATTTIAELREQLSSTQSDISTVTHSVEDITGRVKTVEDKIAESYDVSDYDATTPEREDIDGNIITEIP